MKYKIAVMTDKWVEKKAFREKVNINNALDPTHPNFLVPTLIPELITENEVDGWVFHGMASQMIAVFTKRDNGEPCKHTYGYYDDFAGNTQLGYEPVDETAEIKFTFCPLCGEKL